MKKFNYSAISTSRRCNKLYQYLYLDKVPNPSDPSGDMAFGSCLHMGIQAYLEGDDGVPQFELAWEIERSKRNRYGRYRWEELKKQGFIFLERFERLHLKHFTPEYIERTFELLIPENELIVYGTPDLIGEYKGKPCVVDFKTSGSKYDKNRAQVSEQMWFYAFLARQLGYKVEELVYMVFVKGEKPSIQVVTYPHSREEEDLVVKEFLHNCVTLKDQKVFTRNLASCIMGNIKCDYYEKCHKQKT